MSAVSDLTVIDGAGEHWHVVACQTYFTLQNPEHGAVTVPGETLTKLAEQMGIGGLPQTPSRGQCGASREG